MCGHFFDHGVGKILAQAAPIAAAFIPGVGPLASAALVAGTAGLSTKLQGGSWGDALKSGALSGLGAAAAPILGNAFSSFAPETAASFGITANSPTVLSSLGIDTPFSGAASQMPSLASRFGFSGQTPDLSSGLSQASAANMGAGASGLNNAALSQMGPNYVNQSMPFANDPYGAAQAGVDSTLSPSVLAADPSIAGRAGAAGGGSDSSLLSKVGNWATNNPIPLALGAATLYSGAKTAADRTKQQDAAQAATTAKNAQDLANWKLTLSQPAMDRKLNPAINGADYNTYGSRPEQNFFLNNQLNPSQFLAKGGHVKKYAEGGSTDGEPDMDPLPDLREKVKKLPKKPSTDGEPDMDPIKKAKGGKMFPRKNGNISGPGGPTGDRIKAMLSDGEYVLKAKAVSRIGGGDNKKGAKVLDKINNGAAHRLHALGNKINSLKAKRA